MNWACGVAIIFFFPPPPLVSPLFSSSSPFCRYHFPLLPTTNNPRDFVNLNCENEIKRKSVFATLFAFGGIVVTIFFIATNSSYVSHIRVLSRSVLTQVSSIQSYSGRRFLFFLCFGDAVALLVEVAMIAIAPSSNGLISCPLPPSSRHSNAAIASRPTPSRWNAPTSESLLASATIFTSRPSASSPTSGALRRGGLFSSFSVRCRAVWLLCFCALDASDASVVAGAIECVLTNLAHWFGGPKPSPAHSHRLFFAALALLAHRNSKPAQRRGQRLVFLLYMRKFGRIRVCICPFFFFW